MLKGKTIIELTDVNTGEKEVIEENNMVTNAINDLFNTLPNLLNPYTIYEGSEWYMSGFQRLYEFLLGGILLFDGQIEEKAENTYAPANVNLVGCGVYNHKNSSDKNKVRGDYNGVESEFNEEQKCMKFVYDFSTSEANGTIASVCLTSYYGGCTSYGNKEVEFIKNTDGKRSQNYYNFCKHVFYHLQQDSNGEFLVSSTMPRCFSGDVNYKKAVNDKDYSVILTPDEFSGNIIRTDIYDKEHPIFVDIDEDAVYYLKTKHETHFNSYWIAKRKAYLKSVSILDFPMAKGELIEEVEVISDISFKKYTNYAGKYYCYDVAQQCLYIFVGGYSTCNNDSNIELIKVDLSNGLTNAQGQEITVKNMTGVTVDILSYSKPFVSNGFLYVNKYYSNNTTTTKSEIYKIEIANPANVKKLKDETIPNYQSDGVNVWYDTTQYYRPIYEHCGTIYMNNGYIIRNDEVLRTELSYFYYDNNIYSPANGFKTNIIPILKNKKSSPFIYISGGKTPSSSSSETYLYLYGSRDAFCYLFNYLATINNLAEPVTKTADKTMKVTYIIQETEP